MATYVQTVTAGGGLNQSKTFTASNADATRMINALRAYYGQVPNGGGTMRDRTDAETIDALFADVIATIKQRVQVQERKAAEAASVDSIQPIVFT